MAKTLLSKPSIFEPYGHSDLYALDNLYFSPLKEKEIWDFSRIREFSPLNLGFIFARAELGSQSGSSEIELNNLGPNFKKGICLTKGWEKAPGIRFDAFLPQILGSEFNFHYKRLEEGTDQLAFSEFFFEKGFALQGKWKDRNFQILFSASHSENRNLPSILKKVSEFNAEHQIRGNFFLRTEKQSYLNFLKPKESFGPLFLQEKKLEQDPFLFLSLDYSKAEEKEETNS
ncbi:hypothetical protein EHQ53_18350 [Leptospira langatensis]|uniref:Uncharacterized protein n=1 Tax=Leptospira langatensis TaxID=2484983 RepID=A0A5F1ZRQ5_9LEPT|nr:hypothetical protein [Leptospira langatensis]TGK05580.1 hypothetical protein EHO57_02590 [Leptospira langatensis]TGL38712.1 hypothetical protein EHQ53_18350 [Leptospira langatensis]